jgi:hypothetical protein
LTLGDGVLLLIALPVGDTPDSRASLSRRRPSSIKRFRSVGELLADDPPVRADLNAVWPRFSKADRDKELIGLVETLSTCKGDFLVATSTFSLTPSFAETEGFVLFSENDGFVGARSDAAEWPAII